MATICVLHVDIVAFLSDYQPGFVEVKFTDAWGKEVIVQDKAPIFTTANLHSNSTYPQSGLLACQLINTFIDQNGRTIAQIDTENPFDIQSTEGNYLFEVLLDHLHEK